MRTKPREFADERRHLMRPEGAVDTYSQQRRVRDRSQKGIECLPGKRPSAAIRDGYGHEDGESYAPLLEKLLNGEQAGFQVQGIESRLRQ